MIKENCPYWTTCELAKYSLCYSNCEKYHDAERLDLIINQTEN